MRLLLMLSILLSCGNLNADDLRLEGPYVLPRYPERLARLFISANFELEANVFKGTVNEIKVLSSQCTNRMNETFSPKEDNQLYSEFRNAIDDALKSWKIRNNQSGKLHLTVVFHMIAMGAYDPIYTTYRIDQHDLTCPTRITIEYHRPGIIID
jgi:hypothetical protein